jgi:NAD(P)-dependent dehydrogenase (short-subunit alcohol dehydrogenase family)
MGKYIVVGGSQGIGHAIVSKLVSQGHQVINLSRNPCDLGVIENIIYDVLEPQEGVFSEISGPIDGLVYCPGSINLKPFHRLTSGDFEKDFQVNVLGAVKVIQGLLPLLKAASTSSIVLFSTVAVQTGMGFHASIASSKGAIEGLTRSLAAELAGSKIRVNAIAPSLTQTPLANALLNSDEKIEAAGKRHPLGRVGQANDLANMAVFLLHPENSWITGQILKVDGGMGDLRA